jgi:uncharacterized membrane protein
MNADVSVRIIWFILLIVGAMLLSVGMYYMIQKDSIDERKNYALVQFTGLMLWLILICLILFWPN